MSFALSKVAWALLAPGNALLAVLVVGCGLLLAGWKRAGRALILAGTAGFVVIAALPVGAWLLLPLERRFPQPELPVHADGIIVLGGAVNPRLSAAWGMPQANDHVERMTELPALAARYPDARIIFTGGSGSLRHPDAREAPVAAEFWRRMGLDTRRVLFEDQSRNTWENAVYSKRLASPASGETWILVTSAFHMPRSVGIFRQVGWEVLPYPVAYIASPSPDWDVDLAGGLEKVETAVREYIGLIAYHAMGRTSSMVPGPEP